MSIVFIVVFLNLGAHAEERRPSIGVARLNPSAASTTSATCVSYLTSGPPVNLPEPYAVLIDHERARVLFAVPESKVGAYPRARAGDISIDTSRLGWARTVDHANTLALADAPPGSAWIDVTRTWPGFHQLFVAHQRHLRMGITGEDCFAFAALMNDLVPPADGARPEYYRGLGLVESTAARGEVGFVARRGRDGAVTTTHAFVPVPGTDWVVHKQGTGPVAALIAPLDEVLIQYGSINPARTIVTYFARPTL